MRRLHLSTFLPPAEETEGEESRLPAAEEDRGVDAIDLPPLSPFQPEIDKEVSFG